MAEKSRSLIGRLTRRLIRQMSFSLIKTVLNFVVDPQRDGGNLCPYLTCAFYNRILFDNFAYLNVIWYKKGKPKNQSEAFDVALHISQSCSAAGNKSVSRGLFICVLHRVCFRSNGTWARNDLLIIPDSIN